MRPVVLLAEGEGLLGRRTAWRQYLVIYDAPDGGRLVIVEMTPALVAGWNFGRVTVQGNAEWPGMDAARIVAWKAVNHPEARPVSLEDLAGFGHRLLRAAGVEVSILAEVGPCVPGPGTR